VLNYSSEQARSRQTRLGLEPNSQIRSVGAGGGATHHLARSGQCNRCSSRSGCQPRPLDHFVQHQVQGQVERRFPAAMGRERLGHFHYIARILRGHDIAHMAR